MGPMYQCTYKKQDSGSQTLLLEGVVFNRGLALKVGQPVLELEPSCGYSLQYKAQVREKAESWS